MPFWGLEAGQSRALWIFKISVGFPTCYYPPSLLVLYVDPSPRFRLPACVFRSSALLHEGKGRRVVYVGSWIDGRTDSIWHTYIRPASKDELPFKDIKGHRILIRLRSGLEEFSAPDADGSIYIRNGHVRPRSNWERSQEQGSLPLPVIIQKHWERYLEGQARSSSSWQTRKYLMSVRHFQLVLSSLRRVL